MCGTVDAGGGGGEGGSDIGGVRREGVARWRGVPVGGVGWVVVLTPSRVGGEEEGEDSEEPEGEDSEEG